MAKYSEEFKVKVVTEYIDGNLSYRSLAKKYHMGSFTPIYEWVKNYERHGTEGLERRNTKKQFLYKKYLIPVFNRQGKGRPGIKTKGGKGKIGWAESS